MLRVLALGAAGLVATGLATAFAASSEAARCVTTPAVAKAPNADMQDLSGHWLRRGGLWMGYTRADKSFIADPRGQKIGWWRERRGRLRIAGHRVDGKAPPLRARIACCYGLTGFQSSVLTFSTPGCWRVVAKAGARTHVFTIRVVAAPLRP